jgi:PBSX family phage terminase large subunit
MHAPGRYGMMWEKIDDKINSMRQTIQKRAIKIRQQIKEGSFFRWVPLSKKQKKLFTWWQPDSPVKDYEGIIADGAIRSGKSLCMSTSFVMWAMATFENQSFAICGKTIGSLRRNVVFWLKIVIRLRGYKVKDRRTENLLIITYGEVTNFFYLFGGKDERSQDLIQGITLAGIFLDEVALMPESFVNQATGRCSVKGSKFWFNCNPQGPMHFFKVNWVDKAKEKRLLYIHFTMDDNLSLSEEIKARYRSMYVGVFFKRYILGLWVMAEGAIYDMFHDGLLFDDADGPDLNQWYRRYYAIDYGTTNPCVFLEIIRQDNKEWVVDEYYYDSKKAGRQKEDSEYVDDLISFINGKRYDAIILDPSAASFKVAGRRRGIRFKDADNEVLDGIRLVSSLFALSILKVHKKCVNLRNELSSYIWDEKASERGIEQPLKVNDHAPDALRYFVKTIVRIIPGVR